MFINLFHLKYNFIISRTCQLLSKYDKNVAGSSPAICSHNSSPIYFAESVYNNNFLAVKRTNWNTFKTGACVTNDKVPIYQYTNGILDTQ